MTPVNADPSPMRRTLTHGAAALLWLAVFRLLARYGVYLLPDSVTNVLSLQAYLAWVAVISTVIGVGLSALLIRDTRAQLGLVRPSSRAMAMATTLALPAFVLCSGIAIAIALPTLLDELRRGGRQLAQQNTGEFGRSLVQTPAWLTLLWGALISPVAEELLFRGALWSFVNRLLPKVREAKAPESNALPEGVLQTSWLERTARALWEHLRSGGVATLVTATIFGLLHADTPGGLGIVRTVSALGLGLCTGMLRHKTGGLAAPLLLHIVFNTASVATARRWVVTDALPLKYGIPTLLMLLAALSLVLAIVIAVATRKRAHSVST